MPTVRAFLVPLWLSSALLASGCLDFLGFPHSYHYDQGYFLDTGEVLDLADADCGFWESEPNDGDDDYEWDTLGLLHPDRTLQVCGELSSTGSSGGYFTGDVDYFAFELWEASTVSVDCSWDDGSSEAYCCYLDANEEVDCDDSFSMETSPGSYDWIYVASAGGPSTSYSIRFRAF